MLMQVIAKNLEQFVESLQLTACHFCCNKEGTAVGIAHAGWRGLVDGIIESLIESFDCNGEDL